MIDEFFYERYILTLCILPYSIPLDLSSAITAKNCLMRILYERIFQSIIYRANLHNVNGTTLPHINILDIAGFGE